MRRIGRWALHDPWMTLNATIATLCTVTVLSIHWLMMLGVVREFSVATETAPTMHVRHGLLGFGSVPSQPLTDLDHLTLRLAFICGIFWVLRLALRGMGHRIGTMRGFGICFGFAPFVVTGVLHRLAAGIRPEQRRARMDHLITLWCVALVAVVAAAWWPGSSTWFLPTFVPGRHVHAESLVWSITIAALQFAVALGGWLLAAFFTRHWLDYLDRGDHADAVTASTI